MAIPQLRQYQQNLKNDIYGAIQKQHKSILTTLATGGGKTIIFSDIAHDFVKRNRRVWVLTHREEIRLQTIEKLHSFNLQPGQIAAGRPLTSNLVQVASIQTLINQLEAIAYTESLCPDLIIVDECHHAVAPTWMKILNYFPNCVNIGFTATPQRQDGLGLGNVYQVMVEGAQSAELTANGYLSEPIIFSSSSAIEASIKGYSVQNNEYSSAEQLTFMSQKHIVNETVDCYNQYFNGAPAIIFCVSVKDCEIVKNAMNLAGWRCGVVKSGMDADLRRDYIAGLGNGKYNAVCSYEVISEGVDVPVLAGVILRRLLKNVSTYLQQTGRGARIADGKKSYIIVDQAGNYYLHGHPLKHRAWSLDGKAIKDDDDEIKACECPNPLCRAFLVDNPIICPYCGIVLKEAKDDIIPADKKLRIVNAELLEVQKPIYVPPRKEVKNNLLNDVVANTFNGIDNQVNTVESKFHLVMDSLNKSRANKIWSKK